MENQNNGEFIIYKIVAAVALLDPVIASKFSNVSA